MDETLENIPEKEFEANILSDPKYAEGLKHWDIVEEDSMYISDEMTKDLTQKIIQGEDKFNLTSCLLATMKTLMKLCSFMYDDEEELLQAVAKAREMIPTVIIPALLDPTPCGICESCKNGNPGECVRPNMDRANTETRFLGMLAASLLEYDMFNKCLYKYSHLDEEEKEDE